MSALLDTSLLVAAPSTQVPATLLEEGWAVSAVTVGELEAGVLLAADAADRARRLRQLLAVLEEAPVLDVDGVVASRYGELRATTGRRPSNDLWIAATALAHGMDLVTADEQQSSLPLVSVALVR